MCLVYRRDTATAASIEEELKYFIDLVLKVRHLSMSIFDVEFILTRLHCLLCCFFI